MFPFRLWCVWFSKHWVLLFSLSVSWGKIPRAGNRNRRSRVMNWRPELQLLVGNILEKQAQKPQCVHTGSHKYPPVALDELPPTLENSFRPPTTRTRPKTTKYEASRVIIMAPWDGERANAALPTRFKHGGVAFHTKLCWPRIV